MPSKMFPFITVPDWNPLGGECHYNCYGGGCWAKRLIAHGYLAVDEDPLFKLLGGY